jgi:hypothetical protein
VADRRGHRRERGGRVREAPSRRGGSSAHPEDPGAREERGSGGSSS